MKRLTCIIFALLAGAVFCAGTRPACAETTSHVDDDAPADFVLTVQSTPITGVYIAGDKPGTTDYTVTCDDREVVRLVAPLTVVVASERYEFVRWVVDGSDQPARQAQMQFTVDADLAARAVYAHIGRMYIQGPNERGEGRLPPATGLTIDTIGLFFVDIYAENMPGFGGFQATLDFVDNTLTNAAESTILLAYNHIPPEGGAPWNDRQITWNQEFLPEIIEVTSGATVGLLSQEREWIGFPPEPGDFVDKTITDKTWLMTVGYWYIPGAEGDGSMTYTIGADEATTTFADADALRIPYSVVTGSVSIGSGAPGPHTLTVKSIPIDGIDISGDKPGTTDYTATCDDMELVKLTAPAAVTVGGVPYDFVQWRGDSVPAGQNAKVLMDGDQTAVAAYRIRGAAFYVDDNAPNDPAHGDPAVSDPFEDGSADHPYDAIQEAINAAWHGDTIIVRDGTYTGPGNRDIDFNGKAAHLRSENGPEACIIDCQGTKTRPHRGFYFHSTEDENSVVDGFTIRNGYADGSTWQARYGGGIYCSSSSPTITNNTITANTAIRNGGGIYCENNSSPAITNNTITANKASSGGGIYCENSSPTITNNTITANTVTGSYGYGSGGGIYCDQSSPTITNNTIAANTAIRNGGGIYCSESSPTTSNNTMTANKASSGGGIYCGNSSPTITNNTISANTATGTGWSEGSGGGIYCGQSSPTITNNTIAANTAIRNGGGIYCSESSPTTSNNSITANKASSGGGIYCENSSPTITNSAISANMADWSGGGIYSNSSSPTITNNTITANTASNRGGGIYCDDSSPTITNCILWGNGDELYDCSATYSCIQDGDAGQGNISSYPYFVDPGNGDRHLLPWSPCIDAGDPNFTPQPGETDIDGDPRVIGARVDMGADESTAKSLDSDGDGLPDDWEVQHFGNTSATASGDPDGDGLTNLEEYELRTDPNRDARTIHVSAANTADLLADGTPEHPYASIQEGIDASTERVLVAGGTYTEQVVVDGKTLHILGGYDPSFTERDSASHITVIDASGAGSVVVYLGSAGGSLDGLTITGGDARYGGGIHCFESTPAITNNMISGNTANRSGAGIYCYNSSPTITNNTITANTTSDLGSGGGIYCYESSPTITNNTITANTVDRYYGGGIYCASNSSPTITNNTITANTASDRGGGIYCYESSPTITNNTIADNTVNWSGGGIYCVSSSPTITNNTITANAASDRGGGIYCRSSSATITNCILWGNGDELYDCSATYSCIQDGDAGEGNISSYPYFVHPGNGDRHLLPWSPCIDAGDPDFTPEPGETDIDGDPRVIGGRVDMGADESTTKSLDSDGDGLPDDWEIQHFGSTSATAGGDPDGDGLTNLEEYELETDPNRDARVIYVSAANTADPLADGTLEHPYASIQQGVDASTERVLVAGGTYTERVVVDGKTLHILGGYDPNFTERDSASHITVIDASGAGSVVTYFGSAGGSLDGLAITGGDAHHGGGIYCYESSPTITNNTITANTTGRYGGGIYCYDSSPTIANNTITDNTADWYGGGMYCDESSPTIANNTIRANTADWYGGGIYCRDDPSPTITNNTITANTASGGGGIYCWSSPPAITNNTIMANTASNYGGGIYCSVSSSPTITNNTITANTGRYGGGIYCWQSSSPTITNNTITDNTAERSGGGIYCWQNSSPTIENSFLWGNAASQQGSEIYLRISLGYSCTLTIRHSDVAGGAAAAYVGEESILDLDSTNIDVDPLFADPGHWDDNGTPDDTSDDTWIDGDYHLKSEDGRWDPNANGGDGGWVYDDVTSPCINAGDPASDYSNEPMFNGGRINMGAYGNTPGASQGKWILPGDCNGDSLVDLLDLIFVRDVHREDPASGDNWRADVNEDGVINILDLLYVRNRLGARRE